MCSLSTPIVKTIEIARKRKRWKPDFCWKSGAMNRRLENKRRKKESESDVHSFVSLAQLLPNEGNGRTPG